MGILDRFKKEDLRIDSAGTLVKKINLLYDESEEYEYRLYAFFDYQQQSFEPSVKCIEDCFESCGDIRNYKIEFFQRNSEDVPDYLGIQPWRWPYIKVMFNMDVVTVRTVVKFIALLFRFIESDSENNHYTSRIRNLIIANEYKRTFHEMIRADFIKYHHLKYFYEEEKDILKMLRPFNISSEDYNEKIDRIATYSRYKMQLGRLRNKKTGELNVFVNYEIKDPDTKTTSIERYLITGKNYKELVVRMLYLECIGMEQNSTADDFDWTDSLGYMSNGRIQEWRRPMPNVGPFAYRNPFSRRETLNIDSRHYFGEYDKTIDMLWKMSRIYNGNPLVHRDIICMVLPNVIGRLAKKFKKHRICNSLAEELFMRVNELDVDAVIQETIKETERIRNFRNNQFILRKMKA